MFGSGMEDVTVIVHQTNTRIDHGLMIIVRTPAVIRTQVIITDFEMMKAFDDDAKYKLIKDAIRELSEKTLLKYDDLLRVIMTGDNANYIKEFGWPGRSRALRDAMPEPVLDIEPEPKTGWAQLMDNIAAALVRAPKVPRARVVKGGKK